MGMFPFVMAQKTCPWMLGSTMLGGMSWTLHCLAQFDWKPHAIILFIAATSALTGADSIGQRAHFVVHDRVAVPVPERFGINIHLPSEFKHFKGQGKVNLWSRGGNPEGFYTVVKGVATGGGVDYLENRERPWASYWDLYGDGFFDGARIRIYRYEGPQAIRVRTAEIASFAGGKDDSANRFTFTEAGPEVRAGDEYVVERRALADGPGLNLRPKTEGGLLRDFYKPSPASTKVAIDDTTAAPGGGQASLRVDLQAPGGIEIPHWYVEPQGETWIRFDPESTFRFSGWFKQAPGGKGRLSVRCGTLAEREFEVGDTWEQIVFDFPGGEARNARNGLTFTLSEPGRFWMDNVTVHEVTDGAPELLGLYPDMIEALNEFKPGFLRIWQIQNNKGSVAPLEAMLQGYTSQPWIFDNRKLETFNMADLHTVLDLCLQVGADPWIIVSTFYSEEDWRFLMEYLAGPADSPAGRLRAARGREAPWTEVFSRILLEAGNEVWNRAFRPQAFVSRPEDYARYADLMFASAKSSPYYDSDRFGFVVNGFSGQIENFTQVVAEHSREADYIDIANYIGGWDTGYTDTDAFGSTAYESRLLYGVTQGTDIVDRFRRMLDTVNRANRKNPIGGLVYEAGPGYSLPGPDVEIDWGEQRLGKSLASAIGTFDQYMNYTQAGIDGIGHFTFGRGLYWYSHSENQDRWQPHAVTLAGMLRNRLGKGDLLEVEAKGVPQIDLPPRQIQRKRNDGSIRTLDEPARAGVPLVGCHVFRDGANFSVFLISRQFEADTAVAVDLPWPVLPGVQIHRLSGPSMAAHNMDDAQVSVASTELDAFDWGNIHLPPHSIQVISGNIAP